MFDVNAAEKEAQAEIAAEQATKAKHRIKDKLRQIASAKQVLANLEHEYEVLKADIGAGLD